MSQFDDLIARKGSGTPFDKLTPLEDAALQRLRRDHPQIPAGYLDFLQHMGYGALGEDSFMLYSGVITPDELYGRVPPGLESVLLFGDDLQGWACGFDTGQDWRIVEINATSYEMDELARDFAAFMRLKIAEVS